MKLSLSRRECLLLDLVAARESARVSKAKVAKRAGVSRVTVGRIENEEQMPSERVLRAYATTCGLDPYQLLLSWGIVPEEIVTRLQQNPQLVALVLELNSG